MIKRYQISISNVLLCVAIVGLSLGWWIDRNQVKMDMRRIRLEYSVGQENYYRRLSAVRGLGQIGNQESIPALLYAMGDPDFRVCDVASQSLTSITGQHFRKHSDIDPQRDIFALSETETEELRGMFQTERLAWRNWLAKTHKRINPEFDPYEKTGDNVDQPYFGVWFPPES